MTRRRVIVAAIVLCALLPGCLKPEPSRETGNEPLTSPRSCRAVYGFTVSYGEQWLAYYGTGKAIHLESLPGREPLGSLTYRNLEVRCAVFHPVESSLLACYVDGNVVQWSHADGAWQLRLLGRLKDELTCCAVSSAGDRFAVGNYAGDVAVWSLGPEPRLVKSLQHGRPVWDVQFSPDGSELAAGGTMGTLTLWNTETWSATDVTTGHRGVVSAVAHSADGRVLVTAGYDGIVKATDRRSGRRMWTTRLSKHGIRTVAFSPDGRALAVGTIFSGELQMLNGSTGRLLGGFPTHLATVTQVRFLTDGTLLTSSHDGTVMSFRSSLEPAWD